MLLMVLGQVDCCLLVVGLPVIRLFLALIILQLFAVVGGAFALLRGLGFVLGLTTDVPVSHGSDSVFLTKSYTTHCHSGESRNPAFADQANNKCCLLARPLASHLDSAIKSRNDN